MVKQRIYKFKGIEHLYADEKGRFFFQNKPAPKIINNGTLAIRAGRTRYGLKKLRRLAYIAYIYHTEDLPF